MEELDLERAHEVGPLVLKRRAPLLTLCLVVVFATVTSWCTWGGWRGEVHTSPGFREGELERLARSVARLPDPCQLPTPSEVKRLVGGAPAKADSTVFFSKQCRWATGQGTLQVLVAPEGPSEDVFQEPGADRVDVPGATAARVPNLTMDEASGGSSVEVRVGHRFGSVGLRRPGGPLSDADRRVLETLATRLADQLR